MNLDSRLTLEKWALGELPPDDVAQLEARIASDDEFAAWAARVKGDVTDAAKDLPQLQLPAEVESTGWLPSLGGLLLRPVSIAGVGLMALLLALWLAPWPAPDGPQTTWRGSLDLQIHLVHDGVASEQGALVRARAGDRLQYRVAAPQAGFLSVWDLQDDGQLQAWLEPSEVGEKVVQEGAVLLDDYAGSERVFFVWSEGALDEGAVKRSVERAFDTPIADLESLPGLGDGVVQRSILLMKVKE